MTAAKMGFVGVTTGRSSINAVFPRWAEALGLPSRTLVGHDIPLGAPPQAYRDVVGAIAADPSHLGALVTTHKINVYAAAADLSTSWTTSPARSARSPRSPSAAPA